MNMTTISSRDFNQGASRAKKAARKGPVYITERGRPTHVLMTIEDYHRRQGKKPRSWIISSDRRIWIDVSPRYERHLRASQT